MSLLLKCLTLLFFSSAQMNIYERQFPVCGRVNSRWFHWQRRSKFKVSSVNWVSLWRWCQKHFCRCAEVTTGGNVVTFCRCGGIFFTSDSCREGGRAVTPSAPAPPPRSSTGCQRYSCLLPVGDRLEHTEEDAKPKWNEYSERYISTCVQSVSPPAGGVLLLNWDPGASKIVKRLCSSRAPVY